MSGIDHKVVQLRLVSAGPVSGDEFEGYVLSLPVHLTTFVLCMRCSCAPVSHIRCRHKMSKSTSLALRCVPSLLPLDALGRVCIARRAHTTVV